MLRIHDILVCGSGSADPFLWLMDPDPGGPKHTDPDSDPDPQHCHAVHILLWWRRTGRTCTTTRCTGWAGTWPGSPWEILQLRLESFSYLFHAVPDVICRREPDEPVRLPAARSERESGLARPGDTAAEPPRIQRDQRHLLTRAHRLRDGQRNNPLQVNQRNNPLQVGQRNNPLQVGNRNNPLQVGQRNNPLQVGQRNNPLQVGQRNNPLQVG